MLADAEIAQVIHSALAAAGVPDFTITLNNRKILDGLLDSLGLSATERAGSPVTRQAGQDRPRRGAGRASEASRRRPAAGLTEEQANRVLDFAETGRGGVDVLREAEAALGANAHAGQGIANLRTVLDLLDAAGIPQDRIAIDLGLARGLDYYTGIVFETTVKGWEKFGSIASGGRYDNLASLFTSTAAARRRRLDRP